MLLICMGIVFIPFAILNIFEQITYTWLKNLFIFLIQFYIFEKILYIGSHVNYTLMKDIVNQKDTGFTLTNFVMAILTPLLMIGVFKNVNTILRKYISTL